MDAVRHFLGFAEDSDARVRDECVGADCFVGRVPRRSGWPQGMRLPPRVLGSVGRRGGVSARAMSQGDHSLCGCTALPGPKAVWGVCSADGYDDALVVRE